MALQKDPFLIQMTSPIKKNSLRHPPPHLLGDLILDGEGPVFSQIDRSIRVAIRQGRCPAGTRLPSSRSLAARLRVSRTTVVAAYEQLLAEGYLESKTGSGTFVAAGVDREDFDGHGSREAPESDPSRPLHLSRFATRIRSQHPRQIYDRLADRLAVEIDFMPNVPAFNPRSNDAWLASLRHCAQQASGPVRHYADPSGEPDLRSEIADYLGRSRGVNCRADDILIVAGISQTLMLCAQLLIDEGDFVLLEDPHHLGARRAFATADATIVTAPVDAEGIDISSLTLEERSRCRVAYVTPSHQFPSGSALSLPRRKRLLEWASEEDALIIEDDYDSEYRYAGPPIESLKSLDLEHRVLYTGSFSKTLDPALRLGFLIPPPPLLDLFREARWLFDWSSPTLEQKALARFIRMGEFERHLRRGRVAYGRKRALLIDALNRHFEDSVRFFDSGAGLHVMVDFPGLPSPVAEEIAAEALTRGVAVYPAHIYFSRPLESARFIMGFTLPDEVQLETGIRILAELTRSHGLATK